MFPSHGNIKKKLEEEPTTDENPSTCKICDTTFANEWGMICHVYVAHKLVKLYSCQICGIKFRWKHQKRTHLKKHEIVFKCDHCDKTYLQKKSKVKHMREKHGESAESYKDDGLHCLARDTAEEQFYNISTDELLHLQENDNGENNLQRFQEPHASAVNEHQGYNMIEQSAEAETLENATNGSSGNGEISTISVSKSKIVGRLSSEDITRQDSLISEVEKHSCLYDVKMDVQLRGSKHTGQKQISNIPVSDLEEQSEDNDRNQRPHSEEIARPQSAGSVTLRSFRLLKALRNNNVTNSESSKKMKSGEDEELKILNSTTNNIASAMEIPQDLTSPSFAKIDSIDGYLAYVRPMIEKLKEKKRRSVLRKILDILEDAISDEDSEQL